MQVIAEKEDERETIKKILSNHGIDHIMAQSVTRNLFYELEIQKKKY